MPPRSFRRRKRDQGTPHRVEPRYRAPRQTPLRSGQPLRQDGTARTKFNKRQSQVDKRGNEIDKLYEDQMKKLEEIAQMTPEDARKDLFAAVEKEARGDMARIIRQIEAEAREEGEKRARKLIADAIQRVASEHVAEVTRAVVTLPSEEMKGRIVGRNGRNIKAFEQAAGVDVIVDDTPDSVTVSCFDSVRREIGRRALSKLILDGRIHPAHIEKVVEDETKAVEKIINEAGEQAAYDANVSGLHPEVLRMMGRLKFRTSYGQNQLAHAVEVSKLAGILAAEIGANVELAKWAASCTTSAKPWITIRKAHTPPSARNSANATASTHCGERHRSPPP
jgi:ribonuclease Y